MKKESSGSLVRDLWKLRGDRWKLRADLWKLRGYLRKSQEVKRISKERGLVVPHVQHLLRHLREKRHEGFRTFSSYLWESKSLRAQRIALESEEDISVHEEDYSLKGKREEEEKITMSFPARSTAPQSGMEAGATRLEPCA